MISHPLTIGVDGRSLTGHPTGVGRYVKNLLRRMVQQDPAIRFRLYAPTPLQLVESPQVETTVLGMPAGALWNSLDNVFTWNHLRLPVHLLRRPVDLLHCPFYTLPAFCPCPAVVTIHDITFDLHPEWYTRKARVAFGGFAASSARRARHVLTVSECSRRDIISTYGVSPSRVTAVPLAPDPDFSPQRDPQELARVRNRYRLTTDFVLHVGSITPRRNMARLLDAFAQVVRRIPHLLLALAGQVEPPSPPIEDAIRSRGLENAVRVIGYVEAQDLPALYSAAKAVAYPSLYEGFGLPVLEAMACGTPVLASTTSCFPEVAGDAALLVDPLDTQAMAQGLWSILTDESLRARIVGKGLSRVGQFSWDRAATRTLEIYRTAANDVMGAAAGA